jgi:hypothetical protein
MDDLPGHALAGEGAVAAPSHQWRHVLLHFTWPVTVTWTRFLPKAEQ